MSEEIEGQVDEALAEAALGRPLSELRADSLAEAMAVRIEILVAQLLDEQHPVHRYDLALQMRAEQERWRPGEEIEAWPVGAMIWYALWLMGNMERLRDVA